MKAGQHVISVSLGNAAEPGSVLAINPRTEFEETEDADSGDGVNRYIIVGHERFPAGHPISAIVTRVSEIMSDKRLPNKSRLVLDTTLTGAAPVREFRRGGLIPKAIQMTNSLSEEQSGRVPLLDVIVTAQLVVQTNRLEVAEGLDAAGLMRDLLAFSPKRMGPSLELRGGRNDDQIYALAVALWWAEKFTWADRPKTGRPRVASGPNAWMGT